MRTELANLSHCAVSYLSRAAVNLCWYYYTPPLSEIAEKLGKISKYTPHIQNAFGTAAFPHMFCLLSNRGAHNIGTCVKR